MFFIHLDDSVKNKAKFGLVQGGWNVTVPHIKKQKELEFLFIIFFHIKFFGME